MVNGGMSGQAGRGRAASTIYYSPFTIFAQLYAKTAAEAQFQPVHLAVVSLVIVTADV